MSESVLTLLDRIEAFAREAHKDQLRRGGALYVTHLEAVVAGVKTVPEKAAAWLHDIIEDKKATVKQLKELGVPQVVIDAVLVLTKSEDKSPDAYALYLIKVKANPVARVVKLADMRHNLGDNPSPKTAEKYRKGIQYLLRN